MSLFDRIGEKLQSGLSSAAAGVTKTAKSTQIKLELSGVRADLDSAYARLGREAHFEAVQSRISLPYAAETLREIEFLLNRIALLERQLSDLDKESGAVAQSEEVPLESVSSESESPPQKDSRPSGLTSPTLPDLDAEASSRTEISAPESPVGALCGACGALLPDSARFCPGCGAPA